MEWPLDSVVETQTWPCILLVSLLGRSELPALHKKTVVLVCSLVSEPQKRRAVIHGHELRKFELHPDDRFIGTANEDLELLLLLAVVDHYLRKSSISERHVLELLLCQANFCLWLSVFIIDCTSDLTDVRFGTCNNLNEVRQFLLCSELWHKFDRNKLVQIGSAYRCFFLPGNDLFLILDNERHCSILYLWFVCILLLHSGLSDLPRRLLRARNYWLVYLSLLLGRRIYKLEWESRLEAQINSLL